MIYFARVGKDGPIKIGKTVYLPRRMDQHGDCYGGPLEVLGAIDGGVEKEREIHERFAHLRIRTRRPGGPPELFEASVEILGYVEKHCRKPDLLDQLHEEDKGRFVRLQLPVEEHRKLRRLAADEDTNMALLTRRIVLEYLAKHTPKGGK